MKRKGLLATFRLRKPIVRSHRLLLASCLVSAAALNACGAEAPMESVGTTTAAVSIQKAYPRKV